MLLTWVTKSRLRIFRDVGDGWFEYVQYGTAGPVCRLIFDPKRQHYNLISFKESTPGKARSAKPPTKIPGYVEAHEEINVDSLEDEGDAPKGGAENFHQESSGGSCSTVDDLMGLARAAVNSESLQETGKCGTNPESQAPSRTDHGDNDREDSRNR